MPDINENRPGYKKTKVGWIPEEWEVKPLAKLGKWKGGGTPSKSNISFWQDGTIPWVSPKDMKGNKLATTEDYITGAAVVNSSTTLIPKDSILIVTRSGILRKTLPIVWNLVDVTINQDLKAIIPSKNHNHPYIFYALHGFKSKILFDCAKEGTTVESIDTKALQAFHIPLPPLPEQKKIAAILSTWDTAIQKLEQLIAKKQELKRGLMQQLLTGRRRFPEFVPAGGTQYKETKLGLVPVDWEVVKLGDIGEFKNGVNKSKEDFGHGSPFVNLMDIFGKPSTWNQEFSLVNVSLKELKLYNLKEGDVLFVRSSVKPDGVGLTTLVEEDLPNTVYSGFIIRFREHKSILDHNFKRHCFYEDRFRNSLIIRSSVSANTNINQENLRKLILPIPSKSEQIRIAKTLNICDQEIDHMQREKEHLQKQKKGLMQQLLTGAVRVNTTVSQT